MYMYIYKYIFLSFNKSLLFIYEKICSNYNHGVQIMYQYHALNRLFYVELIIVPVQTI